MFYFGDKSLQSRIQALEIELEAKKLECEFLANLNEQLRLWILAHNQLFASGLKPEVPK